MSCEKKRKIGFWTWYGKETVKILILFAKKLKLRKIDGEAEAVIDFFCLVFSFLPMLAFPVVFHNLLDYLLPLFSTIFFGLTILAHGIYRMEDC